MMVPENEPLMEKEESCNNLPEYLKISLGNFLPSSDLTSIVVPLQLSTSGKVSALT